jgi:hypothetical protein
MRIFARNTLALAATALLAGSSTAFAQAGAQQAPPTQSSGSGFHEGFGVQVIGGPLFSNLTSAQGIDTSNKTGFLVGLAMGGNRGGRVGVEADVLYGQKGAKSGSDEFKQSVVDVPVMLKLNVGSGNVNSYSIFAQGGGFFDWQFGSKINDVDIAGDTTGYEVGFVLGGGVEFARISVQGRYIRGLKQIDRNFDLGAANDSKTQAFAVLFAFRLN